MSYGVSMNADGGRPPPRHEGARTAPRITVAGVGMHVGRARITPPSLPADLVSRPSLLDVLDDGDDRALTLVCAPPGYGKSLLLAEWVRDRTAVPTVWVNLSQIDSPLPSSFHAPSTW